MGRPSRRPPGPSGPVGHETVRAAVGLAGLRNLHSSDVARAFFAAVTFRLASRSLNRRRNKPIAKLSCRCELRWIVAVLIDHVMRVAAAVVRSSMRP
jgi:hypothetical protein